MNQTEKPQPRYVLGQTITVPDKVHSAKEARIVGYEWGENLKGHNAPYWVYYIGLPDGGPAWQATEMEIREWQK